jgi:hypothetical protein
MWQRKNACVSLAFLLMPSAPWAALKAQESAPPSGNGYLVLSLGPMLDKASVALFLEYASDNAAIENEAEWLSVSPAPNDYDLKNGDRGAVYAASLPPGS